MALLRARSTHVHRNQTLTLRGDFRGTGQDPTRLGTLSLPATAGEQAGHGGGLMATLTSRFGTIINELRAYGSIDHRNASAYVDLPQGRVQIASTVGGSARAISTLVFGGNPGLPTHGDTRLLESSDELSWLPGDASHRIKLGGLLNVQRFEQDATTNRGGTFSYLSLADFEAGRPSQYTRTLAPQLRAGTAVNPAIYLGDTWRQSRALQLNYGMRVEGATFRGAPPVNLQVDSIFGLRTDRFPSELHASPRAGFTLTLGGTPANVPGAPQGGFGGGRGRGGGGGNFGGGPRDDDHSRRIRRVPQPFADGPLFDRRRARRGSTMASRSSSASAPLYPSRLVELPHRSRRRADDVRLRRIARRPLGAAERDCVRAGVRGAARVARIAWASASLLRALRGEHRREPRAGHEPPECDRSESRSHAALHARERGQSPDLRAAVGDRLDDGRRAVLRIARRSELRTRLRARVESASHSEQLTFALQGVTTKGRDLPGLVHVAARARSIVVHLLRRDTGASQATTAGDPNVREWGPSDINRRHSMR